MRTGTLERVSTSVAWLPSRNFASPRRPCDPITMRSQPDCSAVSRIPSAGNLWPTCTTLHWTPRPRRLHRSPTESARLPSRRSCRSPPHSAQRRFPQCGFAPGPRDRDDAHARAKATGKGKTVVHRVPGDLRPVGRYEDVLVHVAPAWARPRPSLGAAWASGLELNQRRRRRLGLVFIPERKMITPGFPATALIIQRGPTIASGWNTLRGYLGAGGISNAGRQPYPQRQAPYHEVTNFAPSLVL